MNSNNYSISPYNSFSQEVNNRLTVSKEQCQKVDVFCTALTAKNAALSQRVTELTSLLFGALISSIQNEMTEEEFQSFQRMTQGRINMCSALHGLLNTTYHQELVSYKEQQIMVREANKQFIDDIIKVANAAINISIQQFELDKNRDQIAFKQKMEEFNFELMKQKQEFDQIIQVRQMELNELDSSWQREHKNASFMHKVKMDGEKMKLESDKIALKQQEVNHNKEIDLLKIEVEKSKVLVSETVGMAQADAMGSSCIIL